MKFVEFCEPIDLGANNKVKIIVNEIIIESEEKGFPGTY